MSWLADLAGRAENLLNNFDEQTGAAFRNHNVKTKKRTDLPQSTVDTALGNRKRASPRLARKSLPVTETKSNYVPNIKSSPTHQSLIETSKLSNNDKCKMSKRKKSPTRKPMGSYSLNHCPKTLVGDVKHVQSNEDIIEKQRRNSLPTDLELINFESLTYKMQNVEVENEMLKNELNVMNREVLELLERLRKTEDGNIVVSRRDKESMKTYKNLEEAQLINGQMNLNNHSLKSQLEDLKQKVNELASAKLLCSETHKKDTEMEFIILKEKNKELEEKVLEVSSEANDKNLVIVKLENDLRHTQSTITNLQNDLERSTSESQRLEKEWDTYKIRVKAMLSKKDEEIKALQQGININEDTKLLVQQIDIIREERDEVCDAIAKIRCECNDMKAYVEQVDSRQATNERVVTALREALREERTARNRAESRCISVGKELKAKQMEAGQAIASLKCALKEKESELNQLRESTSTVRTPNTSSLNVADYDTMQSTIDNEKIQGLTQTLVQKQGRIESLLADNNMLRIQYEKLESKYKDEVTSVRNKHSVVNLHEPVRRTNRNYNATTAFEALSIRLGVLLKYPMFRVFLMFYMIGLHIWVMTVLFTSTPDSIPRPSIL